MPILLNEPSVEEFVQDHDTNNLHDQKLKMRNPRNMEAGTLANVDYSPQ